ISVPETQVTLMPLNAQRPVNYNYHYWSYSAGVNYRLSDALAIFGRYSRGGRANADRFLFGNNTNPTTLMKSRNKIHKTSMGASKSFS
ncbi:MAG: TonB-dependent receptor, partial [Actinobacteria bacterium]|nr:TonB-dependent receptor [Actinomycetota bacterium]